MRTKLSQFVNFLNTKADFILQGNDSNWTITNLRHGRDKIFIKDIATTYFCEKKLDFIYGNTVSEINDPSKLRKLESDLETKRSITNWGIEQHILREPDKENAEQVNLRGIYRGVLLMGRPDSVTNPSPIYVIDDKNSTRNVPYNDPWNSDRVQINTYLYCLNYMINDSEYSKEQTIPIINYYDISGKLARKYSYQYNEVEKAKTLSDLDFVIAYWTNQRPAIPAGINMRYKKCPRCDYRHICEYALGVKD